MKNDQLTYWNQKAYEKNFTHPVRFEFLKAISKKTPILDYGCGYGRVCQEFHGKGYENICGIDFAPKMIERGKKLYPFLNLKNLSDLKGFSQNSFGLVILFAVLTCMPEDKNQFELIGEIKRILKPGGCLYISDYWLQEDERNTARYELYYALYKIYGVFELPEGVVVRHHQKDHIHTLLKKFRGIQLEDLAFTTMNGHRAQGFQCLAQK
jgi:SAM-dependent methyltransferase